MLSYGLTCTTLEEVFMAASKGSAAQQDADKEPPSNSNDAHVELGASEPSERLQVVSDVLPGCLSPVCLQALPKLHVCVPAAGCLWSVQ